MKENKIQVITKDSPSVNNSNNENQSSYVSFNLMSETAKLKIKNTFKTIFILLNITSLLASFVFIIIYKFEIRSLEYISSIFLLFTYLTTLYFITIIKNDQKKFIQNEPQQSMTTNDHHSKPNLIKSHIILTTIMIIIGFNDSLFNLTQFFNNLFLILNKQFDFTQCGYTSLIMSIIENFFKVFYQLIILLFVLQYENYYIAISRKRLYLKLFIIYLLFSFLIQSIYIILQEIYENNSFCLATALDTVKSNGTLETTVVLISTSTISTNSTITEAITMTTAATTKIIATQILTSFKTYEPILYPIAIEFRIFCFIKILNLYYSIKKINRQSIMKKDTIENDNESQSDDDFAVVDRYDENNLNNSNDNKEINKNDLNGIPIIFGVFLMSCTIGFIFFQNDNLDNTSNSFMLIINEFFELILLFFGIILLFVCFNAILKIKAQVSFKNSIMLVIWPIHRFKLKKNIGFCDQFCNSKWRKNDLATEETKIDLMTLNVSCFSLIVYSALSISSLIQFINNKSTSSDGIKQTAKILSLISLIVLLIQVTFQLFIVGFMMYNQNNSRINFKKLIQLLILLNFVLWLVDTFSAKKYFVSSSGSNLNWNVAGPVLIPISLLYRIQTCIILIKIFFDKYRLNTLPIQYKISLYTPMAVFSGFE